jgi:F0F1-type ATP synthase membrane subunit c/vacuolar-type H+-ATPase subunit K
VRSTNPEIPASALHFLGVVFGASIVFLTVLAVVLSRVIEPSLESDSALLLNAVFLVVAIGQNIVARAVIIPGLLKQSDVPISTPAVLGYAFAESPVIYGLVLAIVSGDAWRVAPFTAIALISWAATRGFVSNLQAKQADAEFPRL